MTENSIPLNSTFSADDVTNYWHAYDLVIATTDSAKQADILEREFFAKGTAGLAAVMEARRYTKEEYRQAINDFPKFWASMRPSMNRAPELIGKIQTAAEQLHALYPSPKPAEVYLTVGSFRTNGTVMDSLVLFGTELCMANENVDLSEWPEEMNWLEPYMQSTPIEGLGFLAVHEYTHSRQPVQNGYNLLGEVLYEGVPEFVATLASGQPSTTPAIAYGEANSEAVRSAFLQDIGSPFIYSWLQNSTENEFGTRDLGYYVGYAMAKLHYDAADDKKEAIRELIELDYQDSLAVSAFVDGTNYFDQPVDEHLSAYAKRRPRAIGIDQIENGAQDVDPNLKAITVRFTQPLDTYWKNNRYGPGGEETLMKIDGIETEGTTVTYKVDLEPGRLHELEMGIGYRSEDGASIYPYLITFRTRD